MNGLFPSRTFPYDDANTSILQASKLHSYHDAFADASDDGQSIEKVKATSAIM